MDSFEKPFPVVGIGASAGGLEAVSELLSGLPATTGIAYLFVQHLDPRHESLLSEIISKKTEMTVQTAVDGAELRPDRFYVIPPNATMTVAEGMLRVTSRESGLHKPVNLLFRSMAEHYAHRAVGVVLSGSDADGAEGLEEIKAAGGITMAQAPSSAKFESMPKNAIATGCVDFVLVPRELGEELLRIGSHPYLNSDKALAELIQQEDGLRPIFRLLQSQNGTDFSRYKRSTIQRRLARRMALREIGGLADYGALLRQDPGEVQALAQDLLIRVTGFFRDPGSFQGLTEAVLPVLMENRAPKDPLRIWVPGCASGEEAYSIAIVLLEYLREQAPASRIQIFATDLSDLAIEKARLGFYSDSIVDEVSAERLQRHFIKLDDHYQISKTIRDLCVFARHDVTRDPPFSRLSLVSCRNLLIYLDPTLQRQLVSLFHYSLNADGFLILGASETVGRSLELFRQVEGHPQIYRRQPTRTGVPPELPSTERPSTSRTAETAPAFGPEPIENERALREAERLLLSRFAPAAILIDDSLNVIYFHGDTRPYLEHSRGAASLNLQKLCSASLLVELAPAIREANEAGKSIYREGARIGLPGNEKEISFEVLPVRVPAIESSYYLILFGPPRLRLAAPRPPGLLVRLWQSLFGTNSGAAAGKDAENASLRRELEATRDYLQAALEEHEAAKEEMKSAHEEALSTNEEFISTNEELETAKEELQSANEELGVTNQELRTRNLELSSLNEDLLSSRAFLDAIVETLREPLLVLDRDLRIQKANLEFYETFHVQARETLHRHLYDLGDGQWNIPALRSLLEGIVPEDRALRNFEVNHDFPGLGNKTMLLNARRLVSKRGGSEMILLAIEDITDRQMSRQRLVEANQRKNNFLATLAHELRNPLTPIRLRIDLLRRQAKDVAPRYFDMLDRQIAKLVGIVEDLLDIARIEHDLVELRKEPIDLVRLINDAVEDSRYLVDERRHSLSLSIPSEPIPLMADPLRLEQVISNLLSNAAKYTDTGGRIAVLLERISNEAILTVRDNGIGIAPDLLPQLFEMFFQSSASLDRNNVGLGIGLNLSKRLVELHGGRIEGHSDGLGKGSDFTVHLPIVTEDTLDSRPPRPPQSLDTAAAFSSVRRVLLVDDNVDSADSVAEIARVWGHEVAVAHDGRTALELVSGFRPDIALIDIGLPEMNGYELARRLRQLPVMANVPLVAMTGYGSNEDRTESEQAGFNLHLVKPVDSARLERLLATLDVGLSPEK